MRESMSDRGQEEECEGKDGREEHCGRARGRVRSRVVEAYWVVADEFSERKYARFYT
jgi:hypothetical protein